MQLSANAMAIILGGFLPAILFGVSGVFQKISSKAGVGIGPYLLCTGLAVLLVGGIFTLIEKDTSISVRSAGYSMLFGTLWAISTGMIAVALRYYNGQISQLVPLYNMNTLVAIAIGLALMNEWQHVNGPRLLIGAVLIVLGGTLSATA